MDLTELRRRHEEWLAKCAARGDRLLTYTAPCCGRPLRDRAAPEGQTWDTMATCPHCGEHYLKITHHTFIEALQGGL